MMSKLLLVVSLGACASSQPSSSFVAHNNLVADEEVAPHSRIKVERSGSSDPSAVLPAPVDAELPRVEQIGREVQGKLGDEAVAELDLCVSPAGRVTQATLVKGSSFDDFDAALVRDVNEWQFEEQPGPSNVQTCERARITYERY